MYARIPNMPSYRTHTSWFKQLFIVHHNKRLVIISVEVEVYVQDIL